MAVRHNTSYRRKAKLYILCLVIAFNYIAIGVHFGFLQQLPSQRLDTTSIINLIPPNELKQEINDTTNWIAPPIDTTAMFVKKKLKTVVNTTYTITNEMLENISVSPPFPIDVVYTFAGEMLTNEQRTRYNGELRYSLRSIYKYMPWVRAIYIVVSNNTLYPSWIIKHKTLMSSIPLHIIKHSDIYAKSENAVDNHNSISIESRIHHIDGLSNHYIYFNDDFFMFRNTSYLFFFNNEGTSRFPAGFYWDYYNNLQQNPILTRHVYSKANQKRLNITFKIPYRMEKLFAEHMPRPYTKASWIQLETMYPEWFRFVESHKKRFCSSASDRFGCFEEDMYLMMTSYRVLRYNMIKNETLQNEIKQLDYELFQLLSDNAFGIDIFVKSHTHSWLGGDNDFNTNNLRRFINKITTNRPHTFCMNDVFSNDTESRLYASEMRWLHRFYRRHFNEPISFERRNFTESSLRYILADLHVIKYYRFGWKLSNESNTTHLAFSNTLNRTWRSIKKTQCIGYGTTQRLCCHIELFPPAAYMYEGWQLELKQIFCVAWHPVQRLLSLYKTRMNKKLDSNLNWCTPQTTNQWIVDILTENLKQRSVTDCHSLPRTGYIFNKAKSELLCTHIIRMPMDKAHTAFYQQFNNIIVKYQIFLV